MHVTKRDGRQEPYNREKMYKVIHWAITYKNDNISPELADNLTNQVLEDIEIRLTDHIPISVLFDELIEIVANKISEIQPFWDSVARNLYLQKIHKEFWGSKRTEYPDYLEVIQRGLEAGIYSKEIIDSFTENELRKIGEMIDPDKDLNFSFGGLNLFIHKYSNKDKDGKHFELPQHIFMREAIFAFYMEDKSCRLENIKIAYELGNEHLFTYGTPIRANSLRNRAQISSCVLMRPDDDSKSINYAANAMGLYSKFSGGLGIDVSWIRAKGSKVYGNGGTSSGVIPFIQLYEKVVSAYNQGGKRPGACAVYYDWFHLESPDITMLKDAGGKDDERARKLKYAIKWSRLLSERILNNEDIALFNPVDVPDLLESFGDKFNKKYKEYEKKAGIDKKYMNAQELGFLVGKVRSETGNIYVFFRDNVDEQRMGRDPVTQSNLCVTYDTKILTKEYGNIEIGKLVEEMGVKEVTAWNGKEWSKTPIFRTDDGKGQEVGKVVIELLDESLNSIKEITIKATPYHKWYVVDYSGNIMEKRTFELSKGMILEKPNIPEENTSYNYRIKEVVFENEIVPTYCGTEPKRHKLIFNGVLTGNCNEVYLPTKPFKVSDEKLIYDTEEQVYKSLEEIQGEIALCNLASVNLLKWYYLSEAEKQRLMYTLAKAFDNMIDVAYYPVKTGKVFNIEHRAIGIGVSNFAGLLAKEGIKFTDDEALKFTHEVFEDVYWHLYMASTELAKKRGRYNLFQGSKWEKGLTPLDVSILHNKDSELNYPLKKDWDLLRNRIRQYGVRFEYHAAIAPTQTSGLAINATEGIEPIVEFKKIQEGTYSLPFLAPGLPKARMHYELAWNIPNERLIELAAIRQKFIDQGQSVNLYYKETTSAAEIIKDIIYAEELGLKGLYYLKPMKKDGSTDDDVPCESCT